MLNKNVLRFFPHFAHPVLNKEGLVSGWAVGMLVGMQGKLRKKGGGFSIKFPSKPFIYQLP